MFFYLLTILCEWNSILDREIKENEEKNSSDSRFNHHVRWFFFFSFADVILDIAKTYGARQSVFARSNVYL